jgi:5-methyltetrahydropteroyltriglutamate--homocysteine methyltransferase
VRNRSFHPLLQTIQALDGVIDRVVLELSHPEQWAERALLSQVPASMEIAAGIIDVKDPRVESDEEIRAKLRELLNYVPARRLLVCPSCGLGRRNPQMAIDKCEAMVRAVRLVDPTG